MPYMMHRWTSFQFPRCILTYFIEYLIKSPLHAFSFHHQTSTLLLVSPKPNMSFFSKSVDLPSLLLSSLGFTCGLPIRPSAPANSPNSVKDGYYYWSIDGAERKCLFKLLGIEFAHLKVAGTYVDVLMETCEICRKKTGLQALFSHNRMQRDPGLIGYRDDFVSNVEFPPKIL